MKRGLMVAVLLGAVTLAAVGALSLGAARGLAAPLSGKAVQNQPSTTACARWTIVPSPNSPAFGGGTLWGTATVSASDIWAVGGAGDQRTGGAALIEHWNGSAWQIVPSPDLGVFYSFLYSVAAVSATNVWAVGYYVDANEVTRTLVERWDGATWSVVLSPSPGSMNNQLLSVAAVASSDIWAVGFISTATHNSQTPGDQALIEHWNGARWSVVNSPSPYSTADHLEGVAAVSSNDVWAVGTGGAAGQTLVEHWNGARWSVTASPSPGSGGDLRSVAAASGNDIWAVGYYETTTSQTLTEHWNGATWSVVPSPNVGTTPTALSGVATLASGAAWAVGSSLDSDFEFQTLAEQWGGTAWKVAPSPSAATGESQLLDVTAVSSGDVWAVGHGGSGTLVEHYVCPGAAS
jgi:hypothetical protein